MWSLILIALLASLASTSQAGLVASVPSLPPLNGRYIDSAATYSGTGFTVVLVDLLISNFTDIAAMEVGPDELQNFNATLEGGGDIDVIAGEPSAFALTGSVQMLAFDKAGETTGAFGIEVVELSLVGDVEGIEIIVRESPNFPSMGQTKIIDVGGGLFAIESFFDLFTEISVDGGNTWVPSDDSSRYDLQVIPLPAGLTLLISALVGLFPMHFRL